jgi:hypothetical protein
LFFVVPATHLGNLQYISSDEVVTWSYRTIDDPPDYSLEQYKELALNECKKRGGIDCQLYYAGKERGWWAVIRGYNAADRVMTYQCIHGKRSKAEAEKELREQYLKEKSAGTDRIEVFSWYVPL